MAEGDFWNDQQRAQAVVQEVKSLRSWVEPFDTLSGRLRSALEMDELLEAEPDDEMSREVDRDVDTLGAHERRDRLARRDVEADEAEPRVALQVREVRVVPGVRQEIERDEALHVVATQGIADEVRADEAGGASHQEPHRHRFFVRQSKPIRGSSNGMRSSSGVAGS